MKKLSLILALVLVLTCGVLAACSEETETSSTPATESSEAVVESSAADEESSEADAESSEAVEEESSEAEESTVPAPEAGDTNLAAGKTYTRSQLYRQGGADVQWAWSDTAPIAYDDEGGITFTDGVTEPAADGGYSDPVWAGFHYGCPDYTENGYGWIAVDLGESQDLAKFVLHIGTKGVSPGAGIACPATVEFLVSDDGETWTSVGSVIPEDTEDTATPHTTAVVSAAATGRYVQVRMTGSSFFFVSEIEVFGVAE